MSPPCQISFTSSFCTHDLSKAVLASPLTTPRSANTAKEKFPTHKNVSGRAERMHTARIAYRFNYLAGLRKGAQILLWTLASTRRRRRPRRRSTWCQARAWKVRHGGGTFHNRPRTLLYIVVVIVRRPDWARYRENSDNGCSSSEINIMRHYRWRRRDRPRRLGQT